MTLKSYYKNVFSLREFEWHHKYLLYEGQYTVYVLPPAVLTTQTLQRGHENDSAPFSYKPYCIVNYDTLGHGIIKIDVKKWYSVTSKQYMLLLSSYNVGIHTEICACLFEDLSTFSAILWNIIHNTHEIIYTQMKYFGISTSPT